MNELADVQVLTAREAALVAAIGEAFFPPADPTGIDGPSAGVVPYVDTYLARLGPAQRLQVRGLLLLFEVGTAIHRRGTLFSAAPLSERIARLKAWEGAERYHLRAAFDALRWLFILAYVADPDVQRRIGVPPPAPRPPMRLRRPGPLRRLRDARRRNAGARVTQLERRFSTDQLLTGIEPSAWARTLAAERFGVSGRYLHRAAWLTAWSAAAGTVGRIERARHDRHIAEHIDIGRVDPPLFILGHWRSGTTHLHNLLGRGPDYTHPTVYQVVFPTAFLSTTSTVPALTARLLPETRGYDNVRQGWFEAAEDEIALAKLTGLSPYLAFMFPDHAPHYERYIDFLEAREDERETWKAALERFVAKVRLQSGGRRVVVKSCAHTARIRMLLELYPDAKFVHIHRNPFIVAASTVHMRRRTDWENFLQVPKTEFIDDRPRQVALVGQRIYERYFADRALIPPDNLVEVAYGDLVERPLDVLQHIFSHLRLPGWNRHQAGITPYLAGLRGYRTNVLRVDGELATLVREHWGAVFDEYGYSTDYQRA